MLARSGQVNLSDLRYFSDTRGPEWNTAMAAALTGAAAAKSATVRAPLTASAARGRSRCERKPNTYPVGDYGSLLRDLAGATALGGGERRGGTDAGLPLQER